MFRGRHRSRFRGVGVPIGLLICLCVHGGCSKSERIGVHGRVTRNDGTPVVGAQVIFRSAGTGRTATGFTDADGHYSLGTGQAGEGVLPDGYYVTVSEDRGTEGAVKPATVNDKYSRPNDSGLRFKVEPSGESTFDMVLDPP